MIEAVKPTTFDKGSIAIDDFKLVLHQTCAGMDVTTPAPIRTTTPAQVFNLPPFSFAG
ncbi:MAG: hypothetical protein AAFO91_16760 [Bacteroidota bacterium]